VYVTELKGLRVASGAGVFTGAQQKKESETDHVSARQVERVLGQDSLCHDVLQDRDRDGLDPSRGVILFGKTGEHAF
jgi:hypothetical protein